MTGLPVLNGEVMPRNITIGQFCKEQYTLKLKEGLKPVQELLTKGEDANIEGVELAIDKATAEAWEHAAQCVFNVATQQASERIANALVKKISKG